jgi:hypothetical protein
MSASGSGPSGDNKNNGGFAVMPLRMLLLTALLVVTSLARAQDSAPEKEAEDPGPDGMMVGYGFVNNINGVNLEWAFEHNTVYAIPGYYFDSGGAVTENFVWVTGFRHRLEEGSTRDSGFFTGLMAGHLDGRRQYDRLGVGGELGYQWVADHTRWTLSAGLAALEEQEERNQDAEPEAFFAFSVSLR